ncbi:unnamed protein product [Angiostrongylus costaricensis]|uniref:PHM7_ext domain-containing protein n=1 Tax=Angiostrongylus costaricensis TaxID=334426 RepID=A0A0R3PUG5_ANGCS|nr:unnamed protein product [Angiostrongylus costaricensis]
MNQFLQDNWERSSPAIWTPGRIARPAFYDIQDEMKNLKQQPKPYAKLQDLRAQWIRGNESNDGLDTVEYPLFRVVQAIYTLLSLASLPLLLYVQIKYIFGSMFHGNIKVNGMCDSS